MVDILGDLMGRQAWIQEKVYHHNTKDIEVAHLLKTSRALIHEICEFEDELAWKDWKKEQRVNIPKAKEEFADIFIFVMQLGLSLHLSVADINTMVLKKLDINITRQKNNY